MARCKSSTAIEYFLRYSKPSPEDFLIHYGVKGMKWGVRRTPEELGHYPKSTIVTEKNHAIIKTTITGHKSIPKKSTPNSILDHVGRNGKVDSRSFYGPDGMKIKDIHTTNHNNPNRHPIVPHVHDYQWNETLDKPLMITTRELSDAEWKENEDIL